MGSDERVRRTVAIEVAAWWKISMSLCHEAMKNNLFAVILAEAHFESHDVQTLGSSRCSVQELRGFLRPPRPFGAPLLLPLWLPIGNRHVRK